MKRIRPFPIGQPHTENSPLGRPHGPVRDRRRTDRQENAWAHRPERLAFDERLIEFVCARRAGALLSDVFEMERVSPDAVEKKGFTSNLKRFLRRLGGDVLAGTEPENTGEDEHHAPSPSPLPLLEEEPPAEDPEILRAEERTARRIADERAFQGWREDLENRLNERNRRRDRDAILRANSQRYVDDLILRLDELETELKEAAGREDLLAEAPPPVAPSPAPIPVVAELTEEDLAAYAPPAADLLTAATFARGDLIDESSLAARKAKLQETFDSFSVDAHVCDALVGPRVTQFRVKPGYGVRVDTIAGLDRNIALAMAVKAVRIQAPIPGEPFVGVEVPNPKAVTIRLRSALESAAWHNCRDDIPLVMGMDMEGNILLTDLARAPHMLIAGATGSGKSVCINNFLLSLLYRFRPDELELLLVDPKKVEFAMYQDIPHLIHPLVTDAKIACAALRWLVREMERRYTELAAHKVRNLAGYNARAEKEGFRKMPYIVLVIDEMADLMMTARQDIETPIARLAQMSRAVGIHTVLATQRPSVNVITGVIKANFPARAAFMVSSSIDSRTILDSKGAESLQGQGDMLFSPPGASRLLRLQSPFVDDEEILRVTDHLRASMPPRYRVEFHAEENEGGGGTDGAAIEGDDPLIPECVRIIATSGKASTSFLQRKLKIGYNRAATLMEELEERGYVGPQVGQNPREVLVQPGDI
jgi:S-DNA-T family DNA segregation ATPase FtsK/SpoIIIE